MILVIIRAGEAAPAANPRPEKIGVAEASIIS